MAIIIPKPSPNLENSHKIIMGINILASSPLTRRGVQDGRGIFSKSKVPKDAKLTFEYVAQNWNNQKIKIEL